MHRPGSEIGAAPPGAAIARVAGRDALASPSRGAADTPQPASRPVCVTVWHRVDAGLAEAFDRVAGVHERAVLGSDATVVESLRPGLLRYAASPEGALMRFAVDRIDGRLVFARSEHGGTVVRWTGALQPRRGRRSLARLLAPAWGRSATVAMQRIAWEFPAAAGPSERRT